MSSGMEIESMQTLASFPRPIDPVNGRILATNVSSLSGSRKRKRSEIAVSVDGEGINLHSIQTPRLITSYALPPQAYFTAPPCSIYCKKVKQRAQRFTYASVVSSAQGARPQVLCFAEEVQQSAASSPIKTAYEVPASAATIFSVDVVQPPSVRDASDAVHDVIVVHEDGEIVCLTAGVKERRWNARLEDVASSKDDARSPEKVEHVVITDAESASKGLLKSREDVVASLRPLYSDNADFVKNTPILCLVTSSADPKGAQEQDRSLHLFSLRPHQGDMVANNRSMLQHLVTWTLPKPQNQKGTCISQPTYSLHASSAILHQLAFGSVTTYNLSGTMPRIASRLEIDHEPFQSFTRLSSSRIMASSATSCGIYDTRYNSIQAVRSLGVPTESGAHGKKRKFTSGTASPSALRLLTYFSDIGLAVGLTSNELVGLQVREASVQSKRHRVGDSLLIDSIGKGVGLKQSPIDPAHRKALPGPLKSFLPDSSIITDKKWQESISQLDRYATEHNIRGFESLFSTLISVGRETQESRPDMQETETSYPRAEKLANGLDESQLTNGIVTAQTNGVTTPEEPPESVELCDEQTLPKWHLPSNISDHLRQAHRHKALYALSKIFAWTWRESGATGSEKDPLKISSITIRLLPPNVFSWLMVMGYLTRDMIEQALQQKSPSTDRLRSIPAGDIVTAIVNHGPDMQLLYTLLTQHSYLDISETVKAIKILIQSLDNTPIPQLSQQLLTNGGEAVPNGDIESHVAEEADAASADLNFAFSTLEDGLAIRSQSLRQALMKLHSFPTALITQSLRTTLTQNETIFLIQILRIELADGGWTSRYIDAGPAQSDAGDPSDRAITIIANLLSCALDAIGAGGWLVAGATTSTEETDELLLSLRAEISAALEGIHEASFMKGLLNDFLRYGWRRKKTQQLMRPGKKGMRNKPETVRLQPAEGKVLPLGFKVEGKLPGTKAGLRGEVKVKSKREMGLEISKRVGRYSFERIRI